MSRFPFSPSRPLSCRPTLTRQLIVLFALSLLPVMTVAQTTIVTNTANLTNTFGDSSITYRLINKGSIIISNDNAIGMLSGNESDLTNQNIITVSGQNANGMQAAVHTVLTNQGTLTVTGPNATGMIAGSESVLENILNGTITVNQDNGTAMSTSGLGGVVSNGATITLNGDNGTGLYASDTGDDSQYYTVYNTGTITSHATAATGIKASGTNALLINYPNATLSLSGANSTAMSLTGNGGRIFNSGNLIVEGSNSTGISVNGNNNTITHNATGLVTSGGNGIAITGTGNALTTAGTINATNNALFIDGASSSGNAITLSNSGTITGNTGINITNVENTAVTVQNSGTITSQTAGINISSSGTGSGTTSTPFTISNSGNITVSNSNASGIISSGTGNAENSISNSGTINATGSGANGIFVNSSATTVTNTGTINAPTGHELAIGSSGHATVSQWGTTVTPTRWQNSPALRPFGVAAGGTLQLENTVFTLRPGSADDSFQYDTTYPVARLIDNQGTVTGAISTTQNSVLPMIDVYVHSTAAPGETVSWDNQYFSLNIDPDDSHGQQSNINAIRLVQKRVWLANQILGETLENASDWHVFAQPYHLEANASGQYSSDNRASGLLFGGTRALTPTWRLGFHAGLEHNNLTAHTFALEGNGNSALFGIHSRLDTSENTFLRGQLTGMISQSRYRFTMAGDTSRDKRHETGLFANLAAGLHLPLFEKHRLTPEIGLAFLRVQNPALNINWANENNSDLNIRFDSSHYQASFANATVRYTGQFNTSGWNLSPLLALGLRQTLTGADIHSYMDFMGQRYNGSTHEDKTVKTVEAGLKLTRGQTSAALRYSGNFGNTLSDHIFWAEIGVTF